MNTFRANDTRGNILDLVKKTAKGHKVYRIRHRVGAAGPLFEEDYESLLEALKILSTSGFRASIKRSVGQMKRGDTLSLEQLFGGTEELSEAYARDIRSRRTAYSHDGRRMERRLAARS